VAFGNLTRRHKNIADITIVRSIIPAMIGIAGLIFSRLKASN